MTLVTFSIGFLTTPIQNKKKNFFSVKNFFFPHSEEKGPDFFFLSVE